MALFARRKRPSPAFSFNSCLTGDDKHPRLPRQPLGVCPSGQRDQTVNLTAQPSVVQIHPLPFARFFTGNGLFLRITAFFLPISLLGTCSRLFAFVRHSTSFSRRIYGALVRLGGGIVSSASVSQEEKNTLTW